MTASTNDVLMGLRETRKALAGGGSGRLLARLRRQAMSGDVRERQIALSSIGYLIRHPKKRR